METTNLPCGLSSIRKDALHNLSNDSRSQEIYDALNISAGEPKSHIDYIKKLNFSEIEIAKVQFDIVDGCNLRCIGCPNSVTKPSVNPIPIDILINRMQNIDIGSINQLNLYRLESHYSTWTSEILAKLKSLKKPRIKSIALSTNGQHRNFKILEETLKTGLLDKLSISADGDGTKEMFERMRPPGKWDILKDFIIHARKVIDSYRLNTKITMGITLPPIYAAQRSVDVVDQRHIDSWKRQFGNYIDDFDFHHLLKMPGSLLDQKGFYDKINKFKAVPPSACRSLLSGNIFIDSNGWLQPCCWSINVTNLGDLNTKKYSDIFINKLMFKGALDRCRSKVNTCKDCCAPSD